MSRRVWSTILVAVAVTSCSSGGDPVTFPTATVPSSSSPSTPSTPPTTGSVTPTAPATTTRPPALPATTTIATGLPLPWGLAFLPDGSALVTLRDQGEVLLVKKGARPVSVGRVPGVVPGGEAGLLGIAVSPAFASDRTVFVYLTARNDNRVLRMTFDGATLTARKVIVQGIAKAGNHDGGRLAFGPDGYLYISTGDAGLREASQDRGSLSGKILRVTADGAPAPGNPFPGSLVWTLGHRNVQGLAWDKAGRMYASEFGQNTWDELNLILPGRNYGWPTVEGNGGRSGFVDPLYQWTTDEASPSGITVGPDGAIYMAALRGESLWRIPLDSNGKIGKPQRLLEGRYGRLRTVAPAPDGRLWVFTSNTFRGTEQPGDDKIIALRLPIKDG